MRTSHLLLAATALFLSGCGLVTTATGLYKGAEAAGWKHSIPAGYGGVNFYERARRDSTRLSVSFSTPQRGELYLHVNCPPHQPAFLEKNIVVAFPDGRKLEIEAGETVPIEVGMADSFRVTVPEFTAGSARYPRLEAAFAWSEEKTHFLHPLQ